MGITNTFGMVAGIIAPTAGGLLISQKPTAHPWKKKNNLLSAMDSFLCTESKLTPSPPPLPKMCCGTWQNGALDYFGDRDDSKQEKLHMGPIWMYLEMGRGSREWVSGKLCARQEKRPEFSREMPR